MRFQMPETLDGLDLEAVAKLHREVVAEAGELNEIPNDKITPEQRQDLIQLVGYVGEVGARRKELTEELAQGDALAQARAALAEVDLDEVEAEVAAGAEGAGEGDGEGDGAEGAGDGEGEGAEKEGAEAKDLVLASGSGKVPAGRTFGSKVFDKQPSGRDEAERDVNRILEQAKSNALSITAAANVERFTSGQELTFDQLAQAYVNRAKTFTNRVAAGKRMPAGRKKLSSEARQLSNLSDDAQRYGVARLQKAKNEFTITDRMSTQDAWDLIMRAASEQRLGGQSLVAAGGWCKPSQIVYGFLELETAEGLMTIPEIGAPDGGIQFTKGPQLGELLVDSTLGWTMTEAQAEAGTFTKPVFDIDCPDWDEVRMDAVGYALRAGLLTNTTFPELLRRYLALALIVHARRMNAATIARVRALITDTMTLAAVGATPSATADLLDAIELGAMRIRERYSMGLNATVEAKFPLWVRMIVRSDLSRRNGDSGNLLSVTDQQIDNWFKQRQIAPEFVRDYQPINSGATSVEGGTAGWTTMPTKVEFMLYPAGSYVRLAEDVIDLDTVYDQDNLTKNQFLAAFYEEGFGIANTGGSGVKVTVNLPNRFGVTGYPAIGALANVAPTP